MKVLFILISIILIGCATESEKEKTPQEPSKEAKIIEYLQNINKFEADVIVTYFSNKNINKYRMLQQVESMVGYTITITEPERVAGNITIATAEGIMQKNTRLNLSFSQEARDSNVSSSIILTNFVDTFLSSSDKIINDHGDIIKLTVKLDGDNLYAAASSLWLDRETLTPKRLNTYDIDNGLRIEVIFLSINIERGDYNL